jgi:hypothetical protein
MMVVLYAFSNVGLYFINEATFRDLKFDVLLIGLDTLVLTAALMVNGEVESKFYLAYFLLIIICSIFENPGMIAIISLTAPLAYAGFFWTLRITIRLVTYSSRFCSWSGSSTVIFLSLANPACPNGTG